MTNFISISKPIVEAEEKAAVAAVLESGMVAQGPITQYFEEEFADYCETKYAVALNSGTAAIHCALHAAGVGPGDRVITTPFTFIASANPIIMQGATPSFVDITHDTFNIDTTALVDTIDASTKAAVVVDLFGQPCDYNEISTIADQHKITIIEDACQSIGATYQGRKTGGLGKIGCFSLYATKNMMSAEGGVMTTDDEEAALAAKSFRQHGMVGPYEYQGLGYNYRTTDILAAIARVQLNKVDSFNKQRAQNAQQLIEGLSSIEGIILPRIKEDRTSSFHQFTIRITPEFIFSREEFMERLKENGIGSGIYYPKPLHYYEHIQKFGFSRGDFPVAEAMATQVLSLPVHPGVTQENIDYIISTVKRLSHG